MRHSETFTSIAAALAKAAGEYAPIKRDRTVKVKMRSGGEYEFKYAPLDSILAAVRPALCKHELVLVQSVIQEEVMQGSAIVREEQLETRLIHSSGEWFANTCPVLVSDGENSAQAYGSAITYARRYAITQLLCVVADEDDDGNAAGGNSVSQRTSGGGKTAGGPPISDKQLGMLRTKLRAIKGDEVGLCLFMGVEALEALPKGRMDDAIAAIDAKEPSILQGAVGRADPGAAAGGTAGKPPMSAAAKAAAKKAHDAALVEHRDSVDFIIKTLALIRDHRQLLAEAKLQGEEEVIAGETDKVALLVADAAGEWAALGKDAMEALWLAPSFGGVFTTEDRADLRDAISQFNAAKAKTESEANQENQA